ncbi:rho GTPase-activating protein 20-like isoform X2 [Hyla sarda]|uniref:rho GTPase-activating protein 20-like isoform X2 n=1 Tax=Hyla sarda TaxID=327740 RepID=UPI0024C33746|nr:rho GTPase-activating protein 20-like isoform X2 [Hyla sarda]
MLTVFPIKHLAAQKEEKMRASVQRRRSSSAITRALGRTKPHSRDITMIPAHSGNGLLLGAFCSPNNMFILREKVHLSSGWQTQERHLFLFSDSLIIAKSKSSTMKLKKHVRLSEMWISTCLGEVSEKKYYPEDSFVIGWPTANYVVTFSSSETKEKWLSTLCWHINEVKKNEYPRKIPISVLYLEADEFTSNTTITVCNTDDAEKVIKQATQQLRIPGRASDYHLWVMSAKDESLYPLFGHEQPYSIAMNCVRESMDVSRGSNNNILGTDSTEDMCLEQFSQERLCQFIIKMKPQVPLYVRRGPTQKHCRRKKSLIDWALRRTGSTTLSSASSQSPLTPRKLFGHSLSSVCHNGNLPKPIMDMLLLLYEEGPHTRGIFRRSANAKTCKELKEKLISGDEVHMDGESVFVAAAVITDFLRNIPDSILSSDMHGLWMEVAEIEEPEYKIKVIKSLLDQLPEANFILLQYLFAVLNHIENNSEENQMTASNLAVCIAPNMLWLPSVSDPEEESKSTKKVALLVQFLIENYKLIFGQDAESLFSKHEKQESGSTDDLSGIHLLHGQDSSDELEFASSDLDKSDTNLLKDEDVMFDESLLLEEKEDWDLFSEIAACYQSKTKMDILECYNNDPLNSIGSGLLSPNRDRCSSEPSVCLSSRHPAQVHEPVARQSSCDATIIHNHIDYINQLKQLRLESQKLLKDEHGPNMKNTPRAFWRSTQACIMKERNLQKVNGSSRSSISSLSSTTTSPSVSSLSSLDSAFSYCSESSVFSPSDVTSLPFMFGTSARLHTLSPEITKKKLREWHIPMNTLFGGTSCDLDSWEMQWEMDNGVKDRDKANDEVSVHSNIQRLYLDKEPREIFNFPVQGKETVKDSECNHFRAEAGHCVQKETTVKHIEIKRQESSNDDSLQCTKVTFFMSPNIMSVKSQSDQNLNRDSNSSVSQSRKCQIPQTMFYGQNAPLHSVSRKHHPEVDKPCWQSQLKHVLNRSSQNETITNKASKDLAAGTVEGEILNEEQKLKESHTEKSTKYNAHTKNHSKSITSFSQSIRIMLPSSVKNTVKDYFKHTDPKSPSTSQEVTVKTNLIQNKTENSNLQGTEDSRETKEGSCLVEESFV